MLLLSSRSSEGDAGRRIISGRIDVEGAASGCIVVGGDGGVSSGVSLQ